MIKRFEHPIEMNLNLLKGLFQWNNMLFLVGLKMFGSKKIEP